MPEAPLIAIVDDDSSIRTAMQKLLKSAGFSVATFESAEIFLATALIATVSCLVADMRMAGMSGLALHRQLASDGHAIPTIIITAHMDEVMQMQPQDPGIACYLRKPFAPGELLSCVRKAITKARGSERYP